VPNSMEKQWNYRLGRRKRRERIWNSLGLGICRTKKDRISRKEDVMRYEDV